MYNKFQQFFNLATKENTMSEQTLSAANAAIFHLQFDTKDAIRYVIKHASVSPAEAGQAIKSVMVGYKRKA